MTPRDAPRDRSAAARAEVVLFASVPLTTEPGWQPLAEGELVVARLGQVIARTRP